jgi:hypothetical protein
MIDPERGPDLVTCRRCARTPRDPDDHETWVAMDGSEICPGCLTLIEAEAQRGERNSTDD